MSDREIRPLPGGLTRRSLLGHGVAAAAGLMLVGCGGSSSTDSTDPSRNGNDNDGDNVSAGLDGVRVDVWRDPG